jgi:hypothetical protein
MNRRYLSWLGLVINDGTAHGMLGPFTSKADAVKAVQGELDDSKLTGGVFPIELEEVVLPPAKPVADPDPEGTQREQGASSSSSSDPNSSAGEQSSAAPSEGDPSDDDSSASNGSTAR